ncbi:AAA family ATPase [Neptuniibacter sp.]|uniref:AAA family ATPase n=1 Tax=Neptuniibacter sp. TaxID=1962643 RepID=UPI003B595DC0
MKNNIFFEPPSRLQVLDKLKHMVRFSDFLLLVSGEKGAGKSTLVEQLKPDLNDTTLCCCVVRSDTGLEQEQLLDQLLAQLPSHDHLGSEYADRLKAFYLQLKALKAAGQKCLIVVDDAENLSASSLELLLNLHQADSMAESAQLLLLINSGFADKLLESRSVKLLEGRVHHLILDRMSDDETKEYLSLCHPAADALPAKKLTQLLQLSEGLPGRVDKLLAGEKVSAQSAKSGVRAFPLPAAHVGGIGLILIGILAVSLWQFFPEESDEQNVVGETVSVPLPVPVEKAQVEKVEVIPVTTSASDNQALAKSPSSAAEKEQSIAKQELERRLALQEKKIEEKKPDLEKIEKQDQVARIADELREVVTENAKEVVESKVEPVAEAPPSVKVIKPEKVEPEIVKTEPPKVAVKAPVSKYSSSEQTILGWKASGYTLQMLGARSQKSAENFIAQQKDPAQFYYFSTIYKGAPWHVVIYGEFANRDIANAAIKKLPEELRKMRPWARSARGVQIDIKKK